jgi:hypothetical protein
MIQQPIASSISPSCPKKSQTTDLPKRVRIRPKIPKSRMENMCPVLTYKYNAYVWYNQHPLHSSRNKVIKKNQPSVSLLFLHLTGVPLLAALRVFSSLFLGLGLISNASSLFRSSPPASSSLDKYVSKSSWSLSLSSKILGVALLKTLELQSRILILFGLACVVFLLAIPLLFRLARGVGVSCVARSSALIIIRLRCDGSFSGKDIIGGKIKVVARLQCFIPFLNELVSLLVEFLLGSLGGRQGIDISSEFDDFAKQVGGFFLPVCHRLRSVGMAR